MTEFLSRAKAACLALIVAAPASAHEFWIEPRAYEVEVGQKIEADLKNGEDFKGPTYPFLDRSFTDFVVIDRQGARPVTGRLGDTPAAQVKAERGGLHILAYASRANKITYQEFEKFAAFVESKKLDPILEQHRAEGLPEQDILETYYRYAKALVKVGSGAGSDRALGLPIELVAKTNPYTSGDDGVQVQLLWEGAPLPDWDLQIFRVPPGQTEAVKTHVTTDNLGRAVIPRYEGGEFLVNATQIIKPRASDAQLNPIWESIWATLTYELAP